MTARAIPSALPVIQAPMAGSQDHRLAAAVCAAGGLGSVPAAMLSPAQLREQLERLRGATDRPYAVNFFCHEMPAEDPKREAEWRAALAPYYAEFGLDANAPAAGGARRPFDDDALVVLREFRPAVVSFHFGLPSPELLREVRALGALVYSTATTLDEARWLAAHRVDAIVAQGVEAGGHRGDFLVEAAAPRPTLELVRAIAREWTVPVIAAGGIVDAASAAAARDAGAAAVQAGTAYLFCPEATPSAVHRAALASPGGDGTAYTNLFSGRPARGLWNRLMRELGPISPIAPAFPLAGRAIAPLRAAAEQRGSPDFSPLWAGMGVARCRAFAAAELTLELAGAGTHGP